MIAFLYCDTQCRALSVAVFGSPDRIEPLSVSFSNRFAILSNHSIDVVAQTVTHTMGRDIFEGSAQAGFAFSTPFFYSGLSFGGQPEDVQCVEDWVSGNTTSMEGCEHIKLCVGIGTTHYTTVQQLLPKEVPLVSTVSSDDNANKLIRGQCNVLAGELISMVEPNLVDLQYERFKVGRVYSREPLALVTNDNDQEWSALVDLIVNIFFFAEALNITEDNAANRFNELYPPGTYSDMELTRMATKIVSQLGNYGSIYQKYLGPVLPRQDLNRIHNQDVAHDDDNSTSVESGLLYPIPFGDLDAEGPGPLSGSKIDEILNRGHLICGVIPGRRYTARNGDIWSGFDVDFCRGIAAALFGATDGSDDSHIVFQDAMGTGSTCYSALSDGKVDVVAGSRVSLQARYKVDTTGEGYSFSSPIFYDSSSGDVFAMMTTQRDEQWSDFVYWAVMATISAEDQGVTQDTFDQMPLVNVFGPAFQHMLWNVVEAVGSYEEIYARQLGAILPGRGPNVLNKDFTSPQHYAIPLF